ncbi:phage integrase family protein [Variovorax sp. RT4R15]|uniref:phage integrase family protein n=1 Tax=Variovorax sp. RT4R15 TaxID=3443737 RepID=UPI003F48520C
MKAPPSRKLQRAHFAFMRGLLQGLDERELWDRYLRSEGESNDRRNVRQTVAWIRDEFAAAAQREDRPGTARLVRLDPERFSARQQTLPSLEEFALERGLEDFSEAEQAEAYADAYPEAGAGNSRRGVRPPKRARVIARQLEALRWLESHVAQDPRATDSVAAWLNPAVAERLQRSGLATLSALAAHINASGARWWRPVAGVGALKAARVVAWLQAQEGSTGLRLGAHALSPRTQVPPAVLDGAVAPGTALLPWEKFRVPADLDGRLGQFRAPTGRCLLVAANDYEAIAAWLTAKAGSAQAGGLSATRRAYRKEAERLMLWSVLVRRKPISSLAVEDAVAYRSFLGDPPLDWCGPRHQQRWSMQWRPLEGPLSLTAQRHAMTVLRGLFGFLIAQGYLLNNPFAAVAMLAPATPPLGSTRTLTLPQWDCLATRLKQSPDTAASRRSVRALHWLHATGLRISEVAGARCGHMERFEFTDAQGALRTGWLLQVAGKGSRSRQVPVPLELVAELHRELDRNGLVPDVLASGHAALPILGRFDTLQAPVSPVSASGLAKAIKRRLDHAASGLAAEHSARLKKASAHWLRNSHGAHAFQGGAGHAAMPLQSN